VIIGDKYAGGELIPLGFHCLHAMNTVGFRTKSIVVKNIEGNEVGKGRTNNLWRYRALRGGFYIFKHEYVLIFQKPKKSSVERKGQAKSRNSRAQSASKGVDFLRSQGTTCRGSRSDRCPRAPVCRICRSSAIWERSLDQAQLSAGRRRGPQRTGWRNDLPDLGLVHPGPPVSAWQPPMRPTACFPFLVGALSVAGRRRVVSAPTAS
jgi:hypothetical protein